MRLGLALVTLGLCTLVVFGLPVEAASGPHRRYLPLAGHGWSARTPTPPPTPVVPAPLLAGQSVGFRATTPEGYDTLMQATVVGSEWRTQLGTPSQVYYPQGVYVVAFLDVFDPVAIPAAVDGAKSLRLRDSAGRSFGLPTDAAIWQAAETAYGLPGPGYVVAPLTTVRQVVVFDVLRESVGLSLDAIPPYL